jgi:hypothetical protein
LKKRRMTSQIDLLGYEGKNMQDAKDEVEAW